jgi:hypothetical protein
MKVLTVRVTVEGGVVQHVEVPKGVRVIIADYDVDGCDSDLLKTDDDGDEFCESTWNH